MEASALEDMHRKQAPDQIRGWHCELQQLNMYLAKSGSGLHIHAAEEEMYNVHSDV